MTESLEIIIDETPVDMARQARWSSLIGYVTGNAEEKTITALSDALGVTRKTIYEDFKNPEFQNFFREQVMEQVGVTGVGFAFKNILTKIIDKKDVKTSIWLIEWCTKMGLFVSKDGDIGIGTLDEFFDRLKKV